MSDHNKDKTGYIIKFYWQWPLYTIIVMLMMSVISFLFNRGAGLFSIFITLLFGIGLYFMQITSKSSILKSMTQYAMRIENLNSLVCKDIDLPIAFITSNGYILWSNKKMDEILRVGKVFKQENIKGLFKELSVERLKVIQDRDTVRSEFNDRKYRISIEKDMYQGEAIYEMYLYDETDLLNLREDLVDERIAVGMIYIDNFEEAMQSTDELRRSMLPVLVDRRIELYINTLHGILQKLEKDKYFFIIQRNELKILEERRFDILEDIKTVNIGNEIPVTMSIGIGSDADTYTGNYDFAKMAMDNALGRGGDQAVIKEREHIRMYGGKSQTVERTTRVKARVKAQTLRDLMLTRSKVIIMGHRNMDIDCFGAAIGIWRVAMALDKKAHIIQGEINTSLKPMVERFLTVDYPKDLFIGKEDVEEVIDENTMLVVVDVNRPSITEFPELLPKIKTIVVLDHHRQSAETIQATFSYVEPYASSACEMVSEIVQYIIDDVRLRPAEADAMYAGIVIDTQSFTNQTGVRTFEAAAFLRRKGADVVRVRKMFRENLLSYRAKAEAIHNAEILDNAYAFSMCTTTPTENPTVACAQAANELLNIEGVKASFVLTEYKNRIYLSARSIDEVNVQVIVEKLGGGGHRNAAGYQFENTNILDAMKKIKDLVLDLLRKGELT